MAVAPPDEPDDDRKRVFYTLTPSGEALLAQEAVRLKALVASPDVSALIEGAGA